MATTYSSNNNLGNLLSQLAQIGQQGDYTPQMKLPRPVVPDWMRAAESRSNGLTASLGTGAAGGGYGASQRGSDVLSRLVRAIRSQESGGRYGARNSQSGAAGAYQIMPSNFVNRGGWDYEALGRDISLNEFLNSPSIQDTIARYKLNQYLNKYGDAGAAVAWYAGPGNVKNMYSTKTQTGGYPSLYAYWKSVLSKM